MLILGPINEAERVEIRGRLNVRFTSSGSVSKCSAELNWLTVSRLIAQNTNTNRQSIHTDNTDTNTNTDTYTQTKTQIYTQA